MKKIFTIAIAISILSINSLYSLTQQFYGKFEQNYIKLVCPTSITDSCASALITPIKGPIQLQSERHYILRGGSDHTFERITTEWKTINRPYLIKYDMAGISGHYRIYCQKDGQEVNCTDYVTVSDKGKGGCHISGDFELLGTNQAQYRK